GAIELQLEPFRIAADAAPSAVSGAEQLGRVEPAGIGMVRVQVCEDVRLGRGQLRSVLDRREHIIRLEVDDAAKAGNEMGALERDPVEGEVREAGEHLRLRLPLEI